MKLIAIYFFTSVLFGLVSHNSTIAQINKLSGNVLMITGTEDAEGGNMHFISHLERLGLTVDYMLDTTVTSEMLKKYDLVIIPSTIRSWKASIYKTAEIPIICWESYAFDKELGMVKDIDGHYGGVEFAHDDDSLINHLNILKPEHPLAAGLKGEVKVFNATKWKHSVENPESNFVYGYPGGNAIKIASIGDELKKKEVEQFYAIFAYDKGDLLAYDNQPAPARRVGLFLHHAAPLYLTNDGWKLIDAAICWSLNCN